MSQIQFNGASITTYIPQNARIRVSAIGRNIYNDTANAAVILSLHDGTPSGTNFFAESFVQNATTIQAVFPFTISAVISPTSGSHTYNLGWRVSGSTGRADFSALGPLYFQVELV